MISLNWKKPGSLFLMATSIMCFLLYWVNDTYKEYKKVYLKNLVGGNQKALNNLNHGNFELNSEHLIFKSKNSIEKIEWNDFWKFEIIDKKHIILFRYYTKENNLIISEPERNKEKFEEAVNFVKSKIK